MSPATDLAPARSTYARCLGSLMRADLRQKTEPTAFQTKLASACKDEEARFRAASVAVDIAAKISRATAEANANDEIGYIRDNTVEKYQTYMETNSTPN